MARQQNNNQEQRRGETANLPTLADTYILSLVGAGLWTPEKAKKMTPIILNALKQNPELAAKMNIISFTRDPEVQAQINNIHKSMTQVKQRKEKREQRKDLWYEKTFGNKTPDQLTSKEIEKWSTESERIDALNKADDRALSSLAKAEKDLKYPEDIKERDIAHQNEKNQAYTEKFIDKIAAAEDKKEEEVDKRKRAKGKLIGGAIADVFSGVGEGFQQGRRLRGY